MTSVGAELRSYLPGWKNYFQLAETPGIFRRPGRMAPPAAAVRAAQTVEAGHAPSTGSCAPGAVRDAARAGGRQSRRWWRTRHGAHTALPTSYFARTRSSATCRVNLNHRTAGCGPACPVVWEGSSGAHPRPPIPIKSPMAPRWPAPT